MADNIASEFTKTKLDLQALYKTGIEWGVGDPDSDTYMKIWLTKLTSLDQKDAVRHANRMAAPRRMLALDEQNHPERMAFEVVVAEMSRNEAIAYLANSEVSNIESEVGAELAAEAEWQDITFDELNTIWMDGLGEKFALQQELTEEEQAIVNIVEKFSNEVDARVIERTEAKKAEFTEYTDERCKSEIVKLLIKQDAETLWLEEYFMFRIYRCVRQINKHDKLVFDSVDEVRVLDEQTIADINKGFAELSSDTTETKK